MTRRLPPLNALRAFEATARAGSFTRAAEELFVTQGAISRHVAGLETWLGARLLERSNRQCRLTPAGESYFRTIAAALDQIDYATRQLRSTTAGDALRIKLPPTFAIRWLVPRLARFHARHPGIDVQITTSHQRADFGREAIDLCIHSESEVPTAPGFERLFDETLIPVCSPELLESGPPLRVPADLAGHALLSSMNRPGDWPCWLAAAGLSSAANDAGSSAVVIAGNAGLRFENAALAIQAAIDRAGVAIALLPFVEEDLRQRRLVAPFDLPVRTDGGYYLNRPTDRPPSRLAAAFIAWILAEARAAGPAQP